MTLSLTTATLTAELDAVQLSTIVAVALAASLTVGRAASDPLSGFQSQEFRATTTLVRLDVTVLGNDRQPLRGLTASDFVVKENGQRQEISTFASVNAADPTPFEPSWSLNTPIDVFDNFNDNRRLTVIIVDDAVNSTAGSNLKRVARRVVEQLGPTDMAAVVFTADNRRPEDFTADRSRLLAAIDRSGAGWQGANHPLFSLYSLETLAKAAEFVREVQDRKKLIIYISEGVKADATPLQLGAPGGRATRVDIDAVRALFERVINDARQANVVIYSIDPSPSTAESDTTAAQSAFLGAISANTFGFVIKEPRIDEGISQVFRETSSYYLIGYSSVNKTSNISPKITVAVLNPLAASVIARDSNLPPMLVGSSHPAVAALEGVVPKTGLPLQLSVTSFADPGYGSPSGGVLAAMVTCKVPAVKATVTKNIDFEVELFDAQGRLLATKRRIARVLARPSSEAGDVEVVVRLEVSAPGKYYVRAGAYDSALDLSGSVYGTVDFPDFVKSPVALSGLLMQISQTRPLGVPGALRDLIGIVPTNARVLSRTDRPIVFAKVYQQPSTHRRDIAVSIQLTDAHGFTTYVQHRLIPSSSFGSDGSTNYFADLPLAELSTGQYLLTLEAKAITGDTAKQQLRLELRESR